MSAQEDKILMAAHSMVEIIDKVMTDEKDLERVNFQRNISWLASVTMASFASKMAVHQLSTTLYTKYVNKFKQKPHLQIQALFRAEWKNMNAIDIHTFCDHMMVKSEFDAQAEFTKNN